MIHCQIKIPREASQSQGGKCPFPPPNINPVDNYGNSPIAVCLKHTIIICNYGASSLQLQSVYHDNHFNGEYTDNHVSHAIAYLCDIHVKEKVLQSTDTFLLFSHLFVKWSKKREAIKTQYGTVDGQIISLR